MCLNSFWCIFWTFIGFELIFGGEAYGSVRVCGGEAYASVRVLGPKAYASVRVLGVKCTFLLGFVNLNWINENLCENIKYSWNFNMLVKNLPILTHLNKLSQIIRFYVQNIHGIHEISIFE